MSNLLDIDGRTKGQFPVSIATSMALEGLFGILETAPTDTPPWREYTDVAINVRTLFRNLLGSISDEHTSTNTGYHYAIALIEEMTIIRNVVTQYSNGTINTHFYACSYDSLTGLFPFAFFKDLKTDKQKFYAKLENGTIDEIMQQLGTPNEFVRLYDTNIPLQVKQALLLTNYPVDLLTLTKATKVALLESHTGRVKERQHWNTKLHNAKSLPPMPFDRMTIRVFGDSGNLFAPYPLDTRKKIMEIATQYKWHSQTTRERVLQTIRLSKDAVFIQTITRLYL